MHLCPGGLLRLGRLLLDGSGAVLGGGGPLVSSAALHLDLGFGVRAAPLKFQFDLLLDCTLGLRLGLTFRGH